MEVSGISGIGAAPLGSPMGATGASAAGASAAGAANGGSSLDGTFLQGTVPAGPEMLTDAVQKAPFEELFLTLILLALLESVDRNDKGSSAAALLGLFVGLSLAANLGEAFFGSSGQSAADVAGGGIGGQLNLLA